MINFPILDRLDIIGYGLYPGQNNEMPGLLTCPPKTGPGIMRVFWGERPRGGLEDAPQSIQ